MRFCDELEWALGWIAPEPEFMQRCSHALAADGKVWLVDAVDGEGVEERVRDLGEPAGVIQLLDRHGRDCVALAHRLQVPLHVTPFAQIPGAPFRPLRIVRTRFWAEIALWWAEHKVLVFGDAFGTAPYYLAPGERLAAHPLLRLLPPAQLRGLDPSHVLCGHGEGIHEDASTVFHEALTTARRRVPRWAASRLRELIPFRT